MRIKKPSPANKEELPKKTKKRTSFVKLKSILLLALKRPKDEDRKKPDDLILEIITIPDCVKCAPFFALKLTTMCSCNPKWEREPTQEELVKIENEFIYLSVA